jgi:hypothetical protein
VAVKVSSDLYTIDNVVGNNLESKWIHTLFAPRLQNGPEQTLEFTHRWIMVSEEYLVRISAPCSSGPTCNSYGTQMNTAALHI